MAAIDSTFAGEVNEITNSVETGLNAKVVIFHFLCVANSLNYLNRKTTYWLGQAKRRATKIRPRPSESAFSPVFRTCRPEVVGDVISGVDVD